MTPTSSRSTTAACVLIAGLTLFVAREAHALSGLYLQLGAGYGKYGGSELVLEEDPATPDMPVTGGGCCAKGGLGMQLRLGYSLFGMAGELGFVGNAWDIGGDVGGGGVVGGGVRIFPLDLLALLGLDATGLPIDFGAGALFGYSLVGKAFAYKGFAVDFDVHLDYEVTSFLSVGAKVDFGFPSFGDFVFTDYKNDTGRCLDDRGGQILDNSTGGDAAGRGKRDALTCDGRGPKTTYVAPQLVLTFHVNFLE